MSTSLSLDATPPRIVNRWIQLVAGIIAMAAIANLQYAWTLFTGPLTRNLHASLAAVQVAFAAFVLTETWLVPFEGYLVDRIGPRVMLLFGGVLVGAGWVGSGLATNIRALIFWYAMGGVGAGVVYGATIGNALKWFPDRRGLCVGLTAGAYGVGTALTIAPISHMMKTSGYAHTLVIVYTAKGVASVFAGPVAALASVKTGSWVQVFWVMIACDVVAAFMALLWLKPVAAKTIAKTEMEMKVGAGGQFRPAA